MSAPVKVGGSRVGAPVSWRATSPGHVVAGGHQPVDAAVDQGALADGPDVGALRCGAARRPRCRPARRRSMPAARAMSSRGRMPAENTSTSVAQVGVVVVGEGQVRDPAVGAGHDLGRWRAEVHVHPEVLDLAPQGPAAALVDLHRHEPGGELDDVGLEAHGPQRVGRLEPEQAAADDRADRRRRPQGRRGHGLEVVDGAVDERAADVAAGDRRDERVRAGGQDQGVVADRRPGRR